MGKREVNGVRKADVLFCITPMGNGSHFEMALAWAWKIPIVVWEDVPIQEYKTFYLLEGMAFCNTLHYAVNMARDLASLP